MRMWTVTTQYCQLVPYLGHLQTFYAPAVAAPQERLSGEDTFENVPSQLSSVGGHMQTSVRNLAVCDQYMLAGSGGYPAVLSISWQPSKSTSM